MSSDAKILIGIGIITILIIVGGAFLFTRSGGSLSSEPVSADRLIKDYSPRKGDSGAPVTLVEFADFQCPSCAALHPILMQLESDFPTQLQVIFRHFPLENNHKNARLAAQAVEAARAKDKFWEMHDILFERQAEWAESDTASDVLVKYAEEIGLNRDEFRQQINSHEFDNVIEQDKADGTSLRVPGTPTLFINGIQFMGAPSYEKLKALINQKASG